VLVDLNNNNELCFLDKKGEVLLALPYSYAKRLRKLVTGESEEEVRIGSNFFSYEGEFFVAAFYKRGNWVEWYTDDTSELIDLLDTLKGIHTEVEDYG
jgi:hypothetical protein